MTKDKWKYMLVEFVMFNICGVSFYNDYLRFWRRKNGLPYKNIGGSLNVLQRFAACRSCGLQSTKVELTIKDN